MAQRMSALEAALLFQLREAGLEEPLMGLRFGPKERWRFSFTYATLLLAIDVKETQQIGEADFERANAAAVLGWRLLRFTRPMIEEGKPAACVKAAWAGFTEETLSDAIELEGNLRPDPERWAQSRLRSSSPGK